MPGVSSLPVTARVAAVLFGTVVTVRAVRWLLAYRAFLKFFRNLPGDPDFSFIWGNLHKVRRLDSESRIEYTLATARRCPKFHRFFMGPFTAVISLNHPDTVKAILKSTEPKSPNYQMAVPWLGEGLLIAEGATWARNRRLLTPAFHFDILKPYVAVANKASDLFLSKIARYAEEGKSMEMFGNVSLCTLDTILRCAMSYADDIQLQGESHPYVHAVTELSQLWAERARNVFVYNDFVYSLTKNGRRFKEQCDYVHSISETVIQERKQALERDGPPKKRYLDFLDILITARDETGKGMTSLEIRNEVDTFMFEGHDTTASAVSWILYSLCQHQDAQSRVQAEVDAVLEDRESDHFTWEDLPRLEFLTQVIKEGMRLHCPVPFISRQLTRPMQCADVTLPTGTFCTINILALHHNQTVWDDPETFRPDRFSPENMKDKDSFAFVGFSAGPRNCIGQHFAMNEQKVMLGRLLRRFTFSLDPEFPVKRQAAAIMRTTTGMRMFATPRVTSG